MLLTSLRIEAMIRHQLGILLSLDMPGLRRISLVRRQCIQQWQATWLNCSMSLFLVSRITTMHAILSAMFPMSRVPLHLCNIRMCMYFRIQIVISMMLCRFPHVILKPLRPLGFTFFPCLLPLAYYLLILM